MAQDLQTFSKMQTGKPYATYRKTILGKVYITVLNPFTTTPEGMLLSGDPRTAETAMIDVWSEMEDMFFKRMNKKNLDGGFLIKVEKAPEVETHTIEQYSDEELKAVINLKYLKFQEVLESLTSTAVAYRLLELAREMEKSERIIKAIETRLSKLQLEEGTHANYNSN